MSARLLYRDAQGRDAAADLSESGSFLGRAVECVVRTDDAMASRRNCKISAEDGGWFVADLGSANGTYVTTGDGPERRVERERLTHGDVIRCGSLQVRFVERVERTDNPVAQVPRVDSHTDFDPRPGSSDLAIKAHTQTDFLPDYRNIRTEFEGIVKEAQEQREQAISKLEDLETEIKRLRSELSTSKDAVERLTRQAQKDKDELNAEKRVNEDLRRDRKELREKLEKAQEQLDALKAQSER